MTTKRMRAGRPATAEQREHLVQLNLDVYGYVSPEEHYRILGYSQIRAAQETANLQRIYAAKLLLEADRERLRQTHRRLFGIEYDKDKFADIDTYDHARVRRELATLHHMEHTQ